MPSADNELIAIARDMMAAQDEARQIAPFTSRRSDFDMTAACAVADLMHGERVRRGAIPVGRKIGFTNPDMWERFGVREPIWAYVYDSTLTRVDGEASVCRIGRFTEPKIEPEIVLHFHSSLPVDCDAAVILASIDWIAHGFEIVQSHFPGWKFQAADTVADAALHGALFLGEPQPIDRLGNDIAAQLSGFRLSLLRDGELREKGGGANVLGSPLLALLYLVPMLARRGQPIQAGELVTTGTLTSAQSILPGERWSTQIEGIALPGLSVRIER